MLDPSYRARAIPPGGVRYWAWLFASPRARDALVGIQALTTEWHAEIDPAVERGVAHLKLAWWQEEMERLVRGAPLHPVSRYLAALPGASGPVFQPLAAAVAAAVDQVTGVPLETALDLPPHAMALRGEPWMVASRLAEDHGALEDLRGAIRALATAEHLAEALADYRRLARSGRVPFAVDELLAAAIETADLCANEPPERLSRYLQGLRAQAAEGYRAAAASVPAARRDRHRHLLVLAALGLRRVESPAPRGATRTSALRRLEDMLLAWKIARGAQR
ncbi:MAG TPA: squalene/phytoene synthase family protein [Steroidobacteraceae bacterium]|nr:squalene/phytoene synthase family protein [Steroidobacteraceae bacterium]